MKVLVIAAHHDDETLGCGGLIGRLAAEGHELRVLVLGEGPLARSGIKDNVCVQVLKQHKAALKHLGGQAVQPYLRRAVWPANDLPDNRFDTVPLLEIAQRIEIAIGDCGPEVIYTHHIGDLNQDHRAVAQATLIATRPASEATVKKVLAYEVPSSTEWAFGTDSPFLPDTFVDISGAYLERKMQAMKFYETEARTFPHPRSPEALRALAMWRGAQSGLMAAEAFELVRDVR